MWQIETLKIWREPAISWPSGHEGFVKTKFFKYVLVKRAEALHAFSKNFKIAPVRTEIRLPELNKILHNLVKKCLALAFLESSYKCDIF